MIMFDIDKSQFHGEQVSVIDGVVQWALNKDLETTLKSEQCIKLLSQRSAFIDIAIHK